MATKQILNSCESNEWYTPAQYIEAAREVLGGIELDPASCAEAQETVKAERWHGSDRSFVRGQIVLASPQSGLAYKWEARSVFLNPPYGTLKRGEFGRPGMDLHGSNQRLWAEKLIEEFTAGRTQSAILLTNACTSEKWFQPLWQFPICFTDHRIKFNLPVSQSVRRPKASAFVYFGSDPLVFAYKFRQFGPVVQAMKITAGARRSRDVSTAEASLSALSAGLACPNCEHKYCIGCSGQHTFAPARRGCCQCGVITPLNEAVGAAA